MNKPQISPEVVRQFTTPQTRFLCEPTNQICFTRFLIRDADADFILFDFQNDLPINSQEQEIISYQFTPDYFTIQAIGTTRIFKTADKPLKNLLIIERFYYKDRLIKDYEFSFPFCIPNSQNSWESIYDLPPLGDNIKQQMLLNPWETRSDTFLFIENELVLHLRAEYDYSGGEEEFD